MNDFGDTAVTKTINVSSDDPTEALSEEVLELANGCLCCSIKDSGIASIEKLMKRKGAFDYILLETTGLADPGPIASLFWQNEEFAQGLGNDIHLDGVVCVVDAVFGGQQMGEDHSEDGIGESLRQIAGADVVLLNKVDLVSPTQSQALEESIHKINPSAKIHRTVKGQLDLKHILGLNTFSPRSLDLSLEHAKEDAHSCDDAHCGHDHSRAAHHYEVRGISSLLVPCPTLTEDGLRLLDAWIREVLWENRISASIPHEKIVVLRCKGMFHAWDGKVYVLQGVRSLYEIAPVELGEELGVPEEGKLVLIGKGLDDVVRDSLESLLSENCVTGV
ncbi:hypothetical protein EIP86_008586 [Pleurotus ostreatoroseus]|nr:hypothetical protein EIP86_008586 [Pleurotus ostreatoroseus]